MTDFRREAEESLDDLRTHVPGGKVVDQWRPSFWSLPEHALSAIEKERKERYFAKITACIDAAVHRDAFEPIPLADLRHPPDVEMHLAWALHRLGAPLAEASQFSANDGATLTLGQSSDECIIYRGPLELSGNVAIFGTVVVVGDLIVDGTIHDGQPCDSALAIIGNLQAKAVYSGTDHLVSGDVYTDLFIKSSDESSFAVGGLLRAKVAITESWDLSSDEASCSLHHGDSEFSNQLRNWVQWSVGESSLEDAHSLFTAIADGRAQIL